MINHWHKHAYKQVIACGLNILLHKVYQYSYLRLVHEFSKSTLSRKGLDVRLEESSNREHYSPKSVMVDMAEEVRLVFIPVGSLNQFDSCRVSSSTL